MANSAEPWSAVIGPKGKSWPIGISFDQTYVTITVGTDAPQALAEFCFFASLAALLKDTVQQPRLMTLVRPKWPTLT